MKFKKPRGTRDFFFDEMRKRKKTENILRNVFENYGFQEIKTPLFEELELFITKSGEEILNQIYNFKDKSNRELALRPELTAPVARLYLNELEKTASKPIKLYYYGSCFRYERPQKGRFRQFWQFGCELIGAKSPQGEAEVIAMCNDSLKQLDITTADININHLGIIRGLFDHFNIDKNKQKELMIIIDKGDEDLLKDSLIGENQIIDNIELSELLLKLINLVGDNSILPKIKKLIANYPESHESLNELENLVDLLRSFGVENYTINLGVARGLDYYTGIVFEVYVYELGAQKQICGGGTYNLIKIFGGNEITSTGFAFGFDRLMNALEDEQNKLDSHIMAYVAPINESVQSEAFKITQILRRNNISSEVDLNNKKFKKLINHANNIKVPYLIIVGPEDLSENKVTVKDMKTGDQLQVEIDDLINYIKNSCGN